MGELLVIGFIGRVKVQFTTVAARDARRCLQNGEHSSKPRDTRSSCKNMEASSLNLEVERNWRCLVKEIVTQLRVACVLKPSGAQSVTSSVLMREQNARRELRNPKTGKPEDKQGSVEGTMTLAEKVAHERSGHATYISRSEMCIEVGGPSRQLRRIVAEAAHIDNATVMHSQHVSENEDLGWCLCERRDILREQVIARERNPMIWR